MCLTLWFRAHGSKVGSKSLKPLKIRAPRNALQDKAKQGSKGAQKCSFLHTEAQQVGKRQKDKTSEDTCCSHARTLTNGSGRLRKSLPTVPHKGEAIPGRFRFERGRNEILSSLPPPINGLSAGEVRCGSLISGACSHWSSKYASADVIMSWRGRASSYVLGMLAQVAEVLERGCCYL